MLNNLKTYFLNSMKVVLSHNYAKVKIQSLAILFNLKVVQQIYNS